MVFSCKAVSSGVLLGLNRSQHLALLTQELLHCLSHNALLQERGSMLALSLVTLQLEKLCPDWFALAADLLRKLQVKILNVLSSILNDVDSRTLTGKNDWAPLLVTFS